MKDIVFNKYQFVPIYVPLLYDDNATKLLYGSRDSAKSAFACQKMIIKCISEPYFKCLIVRKHKEAVKASLYDTVETMINLMGLRSLFTFKEHERKIICHNGNLFMPLGLYESAGSTGKGKSVTNPTDAIVDEADECTEDEFEKLDFSLRGSENSEIFVIFNTHIVNEEHWIFKRWFPARETFENLDGSHTYIKSIRKNTTILHTTYLMNPFCTKKKKEKFLAQKEHAYERYEISGLGLIRTMKQSNLAVKAFDRLVHVSDELTFNPDSLIYEAWDFNRLPHHTVSLWQFAHFDTESNRYIWQMIREFCLPDHSVRETQKEINKYIKEQNYNSKKVSIVCDYSGNTKKDHDSTSDINKIKSELKRANFEVHDKTIVNPSVLSSLEFVNDAFDDSIKISNQHPKYGGATMTIRIHSSCKFHIADFEKTKTDAEGKILKIKKTDNFIEDGLKVKRSYQARGHGVDNTRYLLCSIFPLEYELNKSSNS